MPKKINVETGQVTHVARTGPVTGNMPVTVNSFTLADIKIASQVDEVTITSLDINTHGSYKLIIEASNSTNRDDWILLYINNDMTDANYEFMTKNTSGNKPRIMKVRKNRNNIGVVNITKLQDNSAQAVCTFTDFKSSYESQISWSHNVDTDTNITRIDIASEHGNVVFGANSRIRLIAGA